jgi:hypothetical protein
VSTVLLAGLGEVGVRAARQLVETDGIDELLVAVRPRTGVAATIESLGSRARRVDWTPGEDLFSGVDAVAAALPGELDVAVASAAIRARVPCATATDASESLEEIVALDRSARAAGVTIAAGCGLAPGLACVLARHASALFDELIEVRVARCGIAGDASEWSVRGERRTNPAVRRESAWQTGTRFGELVWFPEPIGARDCHLVTAGGPRLAAALGDVERLTWLLADSGRRRVGLRRSDPDAGWGAIRVEVFGRKAGAVDSVVYGVVDRTALAAGVVLAAATARLAGVTGSAPLVPGVHALAAVVEPVEFLADLAERGVRAAVFEGVPAA